MSHKFDGTWSNHSIAINGLPPNPPGSRDDYHLVIGDNGVVDPQLSDIDGRAVRSGTATARTIDVYTVDGHHYFGHLIKHQVVNGQSVFMVMAGRFGLGTPPPLRDKATGKAPKTNAQDEGTWVITKP